ncbi:MAG: cytochrome C [Bacteroidia bacterium]
MTLSAFAQLSPGKLSAAHEHLEGLSNCTKCHDLGNQVSDNKCLDCHTEINTLIENERGYHSSKEAIAKTCVDCHSEHHGRAFDALRLNEETFDHDLTGYELKGEHDEIDCRKCHVPDNIHDTELKKREGTYLGMEQECLSCHNDFHQGTLDNDCIQCHGFEKFRPAEFFDHNDAEFALKGAHKEVDCIECHKETTRNGKEFQEFVGLEFEKCTDCHNDEHNGKFGNDCLKCHNINSWKNADLGDDFNHNLTDYPLVGLHKNVDCKECHKTSSYTDPINFTNCKTCHSDYHEKEFTSRDPRADCKSCHSVEKPFTYTLYGLEEHTKSEFALEGAHIATPCFACHLPDESSKWKFRNIGNTCVDCHDNIHEDEIAEKYLPENDCKACHGAESWANVSFEHDKTDWPLEGSHIKVSCRACHFDDNEVDNSFTQLFESLDSKCISCHNNEHGNQFDDKGVNNCTHCHSMSESWNIDGFDHDSTLFPLEGKHRKVDCNECHKNKAFDDGIIRREYKIKKFECIDCHS